LGFLRFDRVYIFDLQGCESMGYIKNRDALLRSGNVELRRLALDIADAGIAAADPASALRRRFKLAGGYLVVDGEPFEFRRDQRLFVIGAGKATFPIAKVIDEVLGARIHRGIVTCKRGQDGELAHMELRHASHPVPDESSLQAAVATVDLLAEVRSGDIVLACFTGGSSSLFVSPVEGVSLADKASANQILLTCGANIVEINDVRKHLSQVKGGRLLSALPHGVTVINLTVSDVIGDALDYITDPTVADRSTFSDAQAVLDKYDLWDRMPASIARHLRSAPAELETMREESLRHLIRREVILVHTDTACRGAAAAARALGMTPLILSTFFEGESSALGRNMTAIAKQIVLDGNPIAPPCVLIGGGETTVAFKGSAGTGGPNQEFALGVALELKGAPNIVGLGLDTDGTDGPTNYAGGIADAYTVSLAVAAGIDLHESLVRHDATPALETISHAIRTGATGTNVNDLKLIVIGLPVEGGNAGPLQPSPIESRREL
jgi:glycerate 2-kinase